LCVRTPESFEQARDARLQISGNPSQYKDLQVFIEEQVLMRRLTRESLLPTLVLDISDNNIDRAANAIADWMTQTDGLWAK
jgi:hypothetical protein